MSDVFINFDSLGLWEYVNNSSWVQLHPLGPPRMVTGHVSP
jgi:hypothetical protein